MLGCKEEGIDRSWKKGYKDIYIHEERLLLVTEGKKMDIGQTECTHICRVIPFVDSARLAEAYGPSRPTDPKAFRQSFSHPLSFYALHFVSASQSYVETKQPPVCKCILDNRGKALSHPSTDPLGLRPVRIFRIVVHVPRDLGCCGSINSQICRWDTVGAFF